MVRRQIQKHAYIWAECVDKFELEAAELNDCTSAIRHRVHAADQRRSNISRENGVHPGTLQNMRDE